MVTMDPLYKDIKCLRNEKVKKNLKSFPIPLAFIVLYTIIYYSQVYEHLDIDKCIISGFKQFI